MAKATTICVIDDDPSFVVSLKALFHSMGFVGQAFNSGEEYLRQFDPTLPGCLILELRLPGLSGLQIQDRLSREPIAPPIIFLSAHADVPTVQRAARFGAFGILQKQSFSETELWELINQAITRDRDNRNGFERRQFLQAKLALLSDAEREVLDLLLLGKSNDRIADALALSRRAVESRRARLMQKLGVTTLPDLVRFGIDVGLNQSQNRLDHD